MMLRVFVFCVFLLQSTFRSIPYYVLFGDDPRGLRAWWREHMEQWRKIDAVLTNGESREAQIERLYAMGKGRWGR